MKITIFRLTYHRNTYGLAVCPTSRLLSSNRSGDLDLSILGMNGYVK